MKSSVHSKLLPSHIITPFDLHVLSTPPAFILSQDQTLLFWFLFPAKLNLAFLFYCFLRFVCSSFFLSLKIFSLSTDSLECFQGCITVYLSRFICALFTVISVRQLWYLITHFSLCQALFYFFQNFYSERRRRDLNPRAAINDLHPFQGCPFGQLGYFSKCSRISTVTIKLFGVISSGEDGIRTHAPFRTNGFQDRLVMTTSIPLQSIPLQISARNILTKMDYPVNTFF